MSQNAAFVPKPDLPTIFAEDTWAELMRYGDIFEYDSGDIVERHGEVCETLNIVVSGAVRMLWQTSDAEWYTGIIKRPGDTISNASFQLNTPKILGARAYQSGAKVLKLGRPEFQELISKDLNLVQVFLLDLSRQLIRALEYLRDERVLPAWLRVARRLHEFSMEQRKIDITQAQLAQITGITRLTVAKSLARLEDAGLVTKKYGQIAVNDPTVLGRWIQEKTRKIT